ncbi:hypothetical protein MRX96_011976 [Rhipicephalus microplus]
MYRNGPTYWFPPTLTVTGTEINENDKSAHFEPLPKLDVVIECKKLVKVFDGTIALNNVNMATYRSQVTILLGHNGAGKTTLMSILAGMIKPNSGSVLVSGRDIRSTGVGCLGYCPQFDALFEDLTVSEHLAYFGGIKGLDSCIMPAIIKKRLNDVRLSDRANAFPKELSGGMKRRLSIALALLTSPEVLILDEPTAALDPETRRSIWSLVKELRGKSSILLSTHDMEEADVLGDRIIVMYNGSIISWGSPSFLKNACGVGYKLRIEKEQKVFSSKAVLDVVKKAVPQATIEEEKENEAIIALHTLERRTFPAVFRELEDGSKMLGVKSTGVTVATMHDAYVKIYTEWVGGRTAEHFLDEDASADGIPGPTRAAKPGFSRILSRQRAARSSSASAVSGTDEAGVDLLHPEACAAWALPPWRLPRKWLFAYTLTPHNEHTRTPGGSRSRAPRASTSRSVMVWPRNGNGTLSRAVSRRTRRRGFHGKSLTKHLGASWCSCYVQVAKLRTCLFAHGGPGAADSGGLHARRVAAILASCRRAGDLDFAGTVDMPEGGTGKTPLVARVVDSTLGGRTAGAQTRSRGDQPAPDLYINLSTMFAMTDKVPSKKIFIREDTTSNNSLVFKRLLENGDIPYDITTDASRTLQENYKENYLEYMSTYAFGSDFNKAIAVADVACLQGGIPSSPFLVLTLEARVWVWASTPSTGYAFLFPNLSWGTPCSTFTTTLSASTCGAFDLPVYLTTDSL